MNNPPPDTLLRFMAELMGYLWLEYIHCDGTFAGRRALMEPRYLKSARWRKADMSLPIDEGGMDFPDWLGSHDAARGLEVKDRFKFAIALKEITGGNKDFDVDDGDVKALIQGAALCWMLFATAEQWCLAWIMSEHGYKWDGEKEVFNHV